MLNKISGKKTYIIAGFLAALLILEANTAFIVPETLWRVLEVTGLITLRAGIKKAER